MSLAEPAEHGKAVVRNGGRQILLVHSEAGVFACVNRCPHEGYPLSEGTLTDGCVLTCNWHNWKLNLANGATLVGGDRLTRYPVRLEAGRVWLGLSPPDPDRRREESLAGVVRGLEDLDQQRLVRETSRLSRLHADPADAVRAAIIWAAERLEFGTTHAIAGAADWLRLFDRRSSSLEEKLAALGEILGHIADDARGGGHYPYPAAAGRWNEVEFLDSVEQEDEAAAIGLLRGGLTSGLTPDDLLPILADAALATTPASATR
jgi:nitrite reductase/ring-hydroxylating ferredoxin subunit